MAVAEIAHKPELTKEQAMEFFRAHFAGKYEIALPPSVARWNRDFVVKKSPFASVAVKLQQGDNQTKFVYTGYAPNFWAQMLLSASFGLLGSMLLWNSITREVRSFIESAPEFK
jgi:hypothetical protein